MIKSYHFKNLKYTPPIPFERKPLGKIFGIDTEAYTTGEPFMFALNTGDVLLPQDFPQALFEHPYVNGNFIVYNIKYDSGAFLYNLPMENLKALWEFNETQYNQYHYTYIPHKALIIKQGRDRIAFWDVSQFYKSTLDKAAQTYLKRKKLDIRTKNFTPKYARYFWRYISKYCIQDAKLTADLGTFFINKLKSFDIDAPSLYSCASIAYTYFSDNTRISDVYRLFKHNPQILKYACDAYAGGKFEVIERGKFTGHEYDIVSAYPYEIRNLIDISKAKVYRSKTPIKNAPYGFLRVRINNPGKYLPCGVMDEKTKLVYYPSGIFYSTITLQEYNYLLSLNIDVDIYDGLYVIPRYTSYPYKVIIDRLFHIKSISKNDRMVYNTSKIIMNSFYGKTVQVIFDKKKKYYKAGPAWNPIHGAVITANTRIKVCEIQNLLKSDCVAVHTDSVMTKKKIPPEIITGKLGNFEHVITGNGIIIACGMYQISEILYKKTELTTQPKTLCAFKGFKPRPGETWEKILNRYPHRQKIPYPQLHVESWTEAMAKNHDRDKINLFQKDKKIIDLNGDKKRVWPGPLKAKQFFTIKQPSLPKKIIQKTCPEHWK